MRTRARKGCRRLASLLLALLTASAAGIDMPMGFGGHPRTNGVVPDIRDAEYDMRPMVIPYGSWETFYTALASRLSNRTNLTAGSLRVADMPTSASGLEPGDLWWDGSNVRVVLP